MPAPEEKHAAQQLIEQLGGGSIRLKGFCLDRRTCAIMKRRLVRMASAQPDKAALVLARLGEMVTAGTLDLSRSGCAGPGALLNDAIKVLEGKLPADALGAVPGLYA
ncbi:MAG: hypothetical protein AAB426_14935 [Myxococcota bacterium]